jgi:hypothetical protein
MIKQVSSSEMNTWEVKIKPTPGSNFENFVCAKTFGGEVGGGMGTVP